MSIGGGFLADLDLPIRRFLALGGLDTLNFMT